MSCSEVWVEFIFESDADFDKTCSHTRQSSLSRRSSYRLFVEKDKKEKKKKKKRERKEKEKKRKKNRMKYIFRISVHC